MIFVLNVGNVRVMVAVTASDKALRCTFISPAVDNHCFVKRKGVMPPPHIFCRCQLITNTSQITGVTELILQCSSSFLACTFLTRRNWLFFAQTFLGGSNTLTLRGSMKPKKFNLR